MLAWKKRAEETCGLGGVSWGSKLLAGRSALALVSEAYISRFALFSSSFFFASSSPAIWFFLLVWY